VPGMDLTCRLAVVGTLPTLHVSGELDLASVPRFRDAALKLIAGSPATTVAIDLDGVSVIDDVGLGVLLGAAARARDGGGDLVLVCTADRHLRWFELTGLARAIEVRDRLHS
jgi:anti-sigma B factor antagonist